VIHRDDYYVAVPGSPQPGKPRLTGDVSKFGSEGGARYEGLKLQHGGEDDAVPASKVESTLYPFIGLSGAGKGDSPGRELGKHLRRVGAGEGKYASTTTGGPAEYSKPPIDR
jgi:hypothetical protein